MVRVIPSAIQESNLPPGELFVAGIQEITASQMLAQRLSQTAKNAAARAMSQIIDDAGDLMFDSVPVWPSEVRDRVNEHSAERIEAEVRAAKQKKHTDALKTAFRSTYLPLIGTMVTITPAPGSPPLKVDAYNRRYGFVYDHQTDEFTGKLLAFWAPDIDMLDIRHRPRRLSRVERCMPHILQAGSTEPLVKLRFLD